MEVLLVMVRHEVHVQMLIKYAGQMEIVKVRVINMMNSKMLYVITDICNKYMALCSYYLIFF